MLAINWKIAIFVYFVQKIGYASEKNSSKLDSFSLSLHYLYDIIENTFLL